MWIKVLPSKAPKSAPNGMHPVRTPLAVYNGIVTPKVFITPSNSTVLI